MIDSSSIMSQDKEFFDEQIMYKQRGFICSDDDLELCVRINRLMPMVVRCGNGRFMCPAQDVAHFVKIIKDSNSDYVRDISVKMC